MKMVQERKGWTVMVGVLALTVLFALPGGALGDSTRGISDSSVKIGIVAPLSRVLAHAGKASVDALQAYFKFINETKGGVHGRKVELVVADHQYEPSRSLAEFKRLVTRDNVTAVIGWGTPPVTILKEPANDEKVPMLCVSGGTSLFNPPSRYVAAMITPYELQAAAVVTYIVEKLGKKQAKIGLFFNNDDFGRSGKKGVDMAMAHYGLKLAAEAPNITGSPIDKSSVTKFKREGVEYLLVAAHSGDVSSLLLEMKSQGLECEIYGVLSPASDRKIVQQAKDAATRYYSVDSQGRWNDTKSPGIQKMIELSKKYALPEDIEAKSYYYILGWYPALFIVEALERAGKALTVEKFVDAWDTFKTWDTGGVVPPITLNPQRRVMSLGGIICKTDLGVEDLVPVSGWIESPEKISKQVLGN